MNLPGYGEVALSLVLAVVAIALSRWRGLSVEKDMAWGSVRAFVQLIAVGYALELVFDLERWWLIVLVIMVMIVVGAHAASRRAKDVPRAFLTALFSITVGSAVTLATLLLLDVVDFEARYLIPLAGMVVGNSMNASALVMDRLGSEIRNNALAIETSLALGKSWRQASAAVQRRAAKAGMISILNFLTTVGIVALPGAMTGMILAGADPLRAVLFQLIVAYMLLGAVTITSVTAAELTVQRFFTRLHQLRIGL